MPHFYMMVGIPGSGKSTVAQQLAEHEEAVLISTDAMREAMTGDPQDRSRDRVLFPKAMRMIGDTLGSGQNVIYDATNLLPRERRRVLRQVPAGHHKTCCYVKTPLETAIHRNLNRTRVVPPEVIRSMSERLSEPTLGEGWDEIRIIRTVPRVNFH